MSVLSTPITIAYHLVTGLADVLPHFPGGLATVAATVSFTAVVRLCLVPFAVSQARGERSRAKLLPQMQAIQKKHAKNPQRLQREMAALYEKEGSPLAGCLPTLLQMPFFFVMYRLFMSATIA